MALGQTSNDQTMHATQNSAYSAGEPALISSGGYMQLLRNNNRSALRVDDRVGLRTGGIESAGNLVSTSKTGINRNAGETRTTSENSSPTLAQVKNAMGGVQSTKSTGRGLSEPQSRAVQDVAAPGSVSVPHHTQAFAWVSGPFDHPSYNSPPTRNSVGASGNRSSRDDSRGESRFGSFTNRFGERHLARSFQTSMQGESRHARVHSDPGR